MNAVSIMKNYLKTTEKQRKKQLQELLKYGWKEKRSCG
jgi:hypothetical protein